MIWFKLGWRNLWRNRRRTAIELSSIAGAVFIAVWWNNMAIGIYEKQIRAGTRMGSGHVGLYREGFLEERRTELLFQAPPLIEALEGDPDVAAVYPRLNVPGLARSSRDSRAVVAFGVDFEREKSGNPLLGRIVEGSVPERDHQALLGADLARELGLALGKKFVWMGQDAGGHIVSRLYRVAGIMKTGLPRIDAGALLVPREGLDAAIGREGDVHELAVMLKDPRGIERALPGLARLAASQPGVRAVPWYEAMRSLAGVIRFDHVSLLVLVGFLFAIVGLGTINTLLMSVVERRREFGVIRALGLGSGGVARLVSAEAATLAVVGIAIGLTLSTLLGLYTASFGLDLSGMLKDGYEAGGTLIEPVLTSGWDWGSAAGFCAAMLAVAVAASWFPARRILKERPAEALRSYG